MLQRHLPRITWHFTPTLWCKLYSKYKVTHTPHYTLHTAYNTQHTALCTPILTCVHTFSICKLHTASSKYLLNFPISKTDSLSESCLLQGYYTVHTVWEHTIMRRRRAWDGAGSGGLRDGIPVWRRVSHGRLWLVGGAVPYWSSHWILHSYWLDTGRHLFCLTVVHVANAMLLL